MMDSNVRRNHFGQPVGFAVPDWTPRPVPPRTSMIGRFARIEPLDPDRHAADLFEANSDDREGRNWTYYNYGPFTALADYRKWIADSCADNARMWHAIIDQATGQAVGVAAYANIQPPQGTIEVGGLNFSPRLQRKPAATDAMYLMMRRVFDELGYRRYEWKCDSCNLPSRAAAARLGFTYEGLFRQAMITRGNNRDTAWFSIIDKEWPVLRAAFEAWLDPGNFDGDSRQRRSLATFRAASG
jgi:RimJ/RimL family protein N-acetyltransferase